MRAQQGKPALRRLVMTMRLDLRLQLRYGLYTFTALTTVFLVALLLFLPPEALKTLLPMLIYFWSGTTTFMFCAAQVLFEKSERTLSALTVTPLRTHDYFLSKTLTLTLLGTLETLALVIPAGVAVGVPLLLAGILSLAAFYVLSGLALAFRYDSVTNFLLVGVLYTIPLMLPGLAFFGVQTPLFYLWPTQAPLVLLQGAFGEVTGLELLYALPYSLVAVALAYVWAWRSFKKHIIGAA